jgi:hypothetical protein
MSPDSFYIGLKVKHPAYGVGSIKAITEHTVDVRFEDGSVRTVSPEGSALQPAEPTVAVSGLDNDMPLAHFVKQVVDAAIDKLGLEKPEKVSNLMLARWHGGTMLLKPSDPSLQSKEVLLEAFFHKIVMMRNQLRVLEQKINAHETLTDAEKVEMQQYITRCYGSMTTFNVLFREKEDGF